MSEPSPPPQAFRDATPMGEGDHTVRQGECLLSIAENTGHFWETIWDHADNADLRRARGDAMVLLPGDRLAIPPIEIGQHDGGTEQRHRFRRKGVPAVLKLQMLRDGEPRADEPWRLELDREIHEGTTDREGRITVTIAPTARRGLLRVGTGQHETLQTLDLGYLAPFDTVLGTQQRLRSLGFFEGIEDGTYSPLLERAMNAFRNDLGLETEDTPSTQTLELIRDAHGS
jgi:N-acetylmuramoyl-L-alanine amidase